MPRVFPMVFSDDASALLDAAGPARHRTVNAIVDAAVRTFLAPEETQATQRDTVLVQLQGLRALLVDPLGIAEAQRSGDATAPDVPSIWTETPAPALLPKPGKRWGRFRGQYARRADRELLWKTRPKNPMVQLTECYATLKSIQTKDTYMALLRLELKNYNKGGTLPVGVHARYLVGPSMREHAAHNLRERPEEAPRADLIASGHQHMPPWADGQELTYWQAAQQYSRKNACLAKEVLVSLPKELDHTANLALIRQLFATLPPSPTTWAFHEPRTRDGQSFQPHCHILVSPRQDRQQGQDPATYFKQPNHGGVPAQPLWKTRPEVQALREAWRQILTQAVREHGLTLDQRGAVRELRLSWHEMKALERFMREAMPRAWGQEYRIPAQTIQAWQTTGQITLRQATWIAQRSQRQLTRQITQIEPKVWGYTAQLEQTRPWQVLRKRQARQGRQRAETVMNALKQHRAQLAQVYLTWLAPELRKAREQYRQARSHERTQGRTVHRSRQPRESRRQMSQELLQLPTLDAALERQQRHQQQGWKR